MTALGPTLRCEGNVVHWCGESLDISGYVSLTDDEHLRLIASWMRDVNGRRRRERLDREDAVMSSRRRYRA